MLASTLLLGPSATAQNPEPLRLVETIKMPNVKGRIDHMDVDAKGKRLFVAGLENGSVEVVDLEISKWMQSIPGFKKPQGISYVSSLNKMFVASGDDGRLRVFRGDNLDLIDSIKLDLGANRIAFDPGKKLIYVGYGGKDAGKDYGEVGIVDAISNKKISDIQVAAHPAQMLLDRSGKTLFVFISVASKIEVIDTRTRRVVATWAVGSQRPGDGAIDDSAHRLFIGTHAPPEMTAMDSRTGKEVAELPTVEGMDGVYFDRARRRIYVSGGREMGEGFVYVYQQHKPERYEMIGKIPTRPGAGTSLWSAELNRYYVAAPAHDREPAAILVFAPQP